MEYDLIIVGAGPGGMNAAVYAGRYMLKTLVLGELPGGMMGETENICNFLSYKSIGGMDLFMKMEEQAKKVGAEIKYEKVTEINKKNNLFEIKTNQETYSSKKVIIATGSEKRKLGLENEEKLVGKGVSYCCTCDGAFYQDKIVAVVGGGNSAVKSALLLAEYAKKIYIIYRKPDFTRVEPAWVENINQNDKIEVIFNEEVQELIGEEKLQKVKLKNQELELDGLFVEIGSEPASKIVQPLGVELENQFIKVDNQKKTNIPGLFAVGDVTNGIMKQIITAAADGAIAANMAYKEIRKNS